VVGQGLAKLAAQGLTSKMRLISHIMFYLEGTVQWSFRTLIVQLCDHRPVANLSSVAHLGLYGRIPTIRRVRYKTFITRRYNRGMR